ncbi:hypothetical protein GALL_184260 [mine drainage metagenome]|uniref:Uncharacterized protein n=1 Tax=mine drainage metagenome TaxID=410659 RepID=A0A1J5RUR4_9ZZZZ
MTTRGFREDEARQVGNPIADVLDNPLDAGNMTRVRQQVDMLTKRLASQFAIRMAFHLPMKEKIQVDMF